MKNKLFLGKWIAIFVILFWVIYTLTSPYMYEFNTDEIWAYCIAKDMNFIEIIKLMHTEGHTFLWYFILKPFTYFQELYPYILKYLNWTFCFGTILLLWKYAPFNKLIKIFITLSSPFLVIYPLMGRPYGLALILLFTLTILYKNRLKSPVLYAALIFLATNTCVNAAFATFVLSCIFIYDLLKENDKNKIILPISIVIASFLALAIQWIPINTPKYMAYFGRFYWFKDFFALRSMSNLYKLFSFLTFFPLMQITLYLNVTNVKSKRWLFFAFFTVNILVVFNLFISVGRNYHFYFLYIYLIMLYWLMLENSEEFKQSKSAYLSFSIFLVSVSILFNAWLVPTQFWFKDKNVISDSMSQIKAFVPEASTIYMNIERNQFIIPYLEDDYILKTFSGEMIPSYKAYRNIYFEKFKNPQDILPDEVEAYYIVSKSFKNQYRSFITLKELPVNCIEVGENYDLCKLPIKEINLKVENNKKNKKTDYKKLTINSIDSKKIIKALFEGEAQINTHMQARNKRKNTENNEKANIIGLSQIYDYVPVDSIIYVAADINNYFIKSLSKKYKLKLMNGSDIKTFKETVKINEIKYPHRIVIKQFMPESNYFYLVSYDYLRKAKLRGANMPKSCIDINNTYTLCKLPIFVKDLPKANKTEANSEIYKYFYLKK